LNDSTLQQVTPSIPVISVQSPEQGQNYDGTSGSLTVTGQQVASVSVFLDGAMITTMAASSSSYSFPLDSASLSLGVHTLSVVATQQDGLSASTAVSFSTEGRLTAVNDSISSLTSQVASANSTIGGLDSRLSSDQNTISSLMSTVKTLTFGLYGLGVAVVLALVLAVFALSGRRGRTSEVSPSGAPAPQ
jgi:hypothetical protein